MRMNYLPLLTLAAATVLSTPAFPEEASQVGPPPVDAEVTVSAIQKLAELRKEIVVAEDRFIGRYNALNKDRQYAIKCNPEAFTGSRFYRRVCRPEFVADATGSEARGWFRGEPSAPAATMMESKKAGFRKNIISLYDNDADLRKLALEHDALQKRYDDLLRRTMTGKGVNE
jgi:hypothetical protein